MINYQIELIETLNNKLKELRKFTESIKKEGIEKSEAERDYRVALAEKILALRAEGYPATITPDLARGDEEVATLRFIRDCAEADYKSTFEAINSIKLTIRILEGEIDREYRG